MPLCLRQKGTSQLLYFVFRSQSEKRNTKVEGVDAYKQLVAMFQNAFPGHRTTVQQLVVEGDTIAVLHTHHAHHAGDFMGLAPTGRDVVVEGIELYRLNEGRIVEFWRHDDDAGLLCQFGLVPEMA